MKTEFIISGRLHQQLLEHLFPGDGLEAVALIACGYRGSPGSSALLAREIFPIPYADCTQRTAVDVSWPTSVAETFLDKCAKGKLAVVKVHSHPNGSRGFSDSDDRSDRALFPSLFGWIETAKMMASLVMLPDCSLIGRAVDERGRFKPLTMVKYVGNNLKFWPHDIEPESVGAMDGDTASIRLIQTFGQGTYRRLRALRIGIVGLSGIGSILAEMLARNCVGTLVLVEPDLVEHKNLNRMLNSTRAHADSKAAKLTVLKAAIEAIGLGTEVETHAIDVSTPKAVRALASCDAVFGAMDSIYGRHLLNRLACFYLVPYFDAGVRLVADGMGGITTATAAAHYLQPDGSSLQARNVYTQEQLEADSIRQSDPEQYKKLLKEGYIKGLAEDRPAVISINALAATMAVNDFLARLHPYRDESNAAYALQFFSLEQGLYLHEPEGASSPLMLRNAGRGDIVPLLDRPDLSEL